MTLTRRQLLAMAAASPLAGLAGCEQAPPISAPDMACGSGSALGVTPSNSEQRPDFESAVEDYAWGLAGVTLLGAALVDEAVVEPDRARLRAALEAGLGGSPPTEGIPGMIRADFEAGAVLQAGGWIVSETEARLAVLNLLLVDPDPASLSADQPTFANAPVCDFITLDRWGPQKTMVGEGFNVQQDGHFGNWFIFDGPVPDGLRIYLGDTALRTTLKDNVATTAIFDPVGSRLIVAPGEHEFWAYDVTRHRKQKLDTFRVEGRPQTALLENGDRAAAICPVVNWGPDSTPVGEVFNPQPDGHGALWFRTACSPTELQVFLGDMALDVTRRPADNLVTAKLLDSTLLDTPGVFPVRFVDSGSGESIEVGQFVVRQADSPGPR